MIKWTFRLFLIGVVWLGYVSYQKGYFSIPDMPDGAYVISFKNGFRGIVLDAEVSQPITDMPKFFRRINLANTDRNYIQLPLEVAPWHEDVWSICTSPSDQEREEVKRSMPNDVSKSLWNMRLDAICRLEVDGETFTRGFVYSAPKL